MKIIAGSRLAMLASNQSRFRLCLLPNVSGDSIVVNRSPKLFQRSSALQTEQSLRAMELAMRSDRFGTAVLGVLV